MLIEIPDNLVSYFEHNGSGGDALAMVQDYIAQAKAKPPKIWVGVFEGKNTGTQVRAFKTEAAKEEWRTELAAERWDDWHAKRAAEAGADVSTPERRADFFWSTQNDCGEEFFTAEHLVIE